MTKKTTQASSGESNKPTPTPAPTPATCLSESETALAVVETAPPVPVHPASPGDEVVALSQNISGMLRLADSFHRSGMFPFIPNAYAALASIEAGREIGLPPIMSLQTIYPIKGRLTMEAKAMLALFQRNGGVIKINERSVKACSLTLEKKPWPPATFTFTMDEAKAIGLTSKDAWRNYPADLLFARCVSRAVRAYDPGSILGMYSVEEVRDFPDNPGVANGNAAQRAAILPEAVEVAAVDAKIEEVMGPAIEVEDLSRFNPPDPQSPFATADQLAHIANGVKALVSIGQPEERVWKGLTKEIAEKHGGKVFAETSELTPAEADTAYAYLKRWYLHLAEGKAASRAKHAADEEQALFDIDPAKERS